MKTLYFSDSDNNIIGIYFAEEVKLDDPQIKQIGTYLGDSDSLTIPRCDNGIIKYINNSFVCHNRVDLDLIRGRRDALLSQSDILYIRALESKFTTAKLNPLKEYRQALRDITLQEDLNNITWPTLPDIEF